MNLYGIDHCLHKVGAKISHGQVLQLTEKGMIESTQSAFSASLLVALIGTTTTPERGTVMRHFFAGTGLAYFYAGGVLPPRDVHLFASGALMLSLGFLLMGMAAYSGRFDR